MLAGGLHSRPRANGRASPADLSVPGVGTDQCRGLDRSAFALTAATKADSAFSQKSPWSTLASALSTSETSCSGSGCVDQSNNTGGSPCCSALRIVEGSGSQMGSAPWNRHRSYRAGALHRKVARCACCFVAGVTKRGSVPARHTTLASQSSERRPSTRLNSRRLLVTKTRPRLRACPAISTS